MRDQLSQDTTGWQRSVKQVVDMVTCEVLFATIPLDHWQWTVSAHSHFHTSEAYFQLKCSPQTNVYSFKNQKK